MAEKRALILGIGGQDGGLLARLLLSEGYVVHGTSRDAESRSFSTLHSLGIFEKVRLHSLSEGDFRAMLALLQSVRPHEIYNLAGQSSVGLSFEQPIQTFESVATATLQILEAIRFLKLDAKFYQASSSEMFGNTHAAAEEHTPLNPRSPYAIAKVAAHHAVLNYREAYGLFACCGILFNHESEFRPARFVTQRVAEAAARIAKGHKEKLQLGNIEIRRDWGWAEEYVRAMWLMLQQHSAEDFVIATGHTHSLREFVDECFSEVGLVTRDWIECAASSMRPTDIIESRANPARAANKLGWKATVLMPEVARRMTRAALNRIS